MSERLVVIGGNAAGMTAASRAKRLAPSASVLVLEASEQIAYSICGLPYWVSNVVSSFEDLVLFTPESLRNERGIEARLRAVVEEIQHARRSVVVRNERDGSRESVPYDKLLVATGYRPLRPDIEGAHARGVFTASRLGDGQSMVGWLQERAARRATLVGGGYIGLEMAEALVRRGLEVTLIDSGPQIFPVLDPDIASLVGDELAARGVRVLIGREVKRISVRQDGSVEAVELMSGRLRIPADLVFIDIGVAPNVDLAVAAGVRLGVSGAIEVSERMQTNLSGVFAAGNCAEVTHLVTGMALPMPLGTVAVKQGRVAGENMAGRRTHFRGALGTSIVSVFDVTAARTGLNEAEARHAGFDVVSSRIESRFQAKYFGGGAPGTVKVLADRPTRRLLGAQIVGSREAAIRIDIVATALTAGMNVQEASQLDLAYAPPVGSLWNPVLVAMNTLSRQFG